MTEGQIIDPDTNTQFLLLIGYWIDALGSEYLQHWYHTVCSFSPVKKYLLIPRA